MKLLFNFSQKNSEFLKIKENYEKNIKENDEELKEKN